jgi:hypothetical protein
MLACCRQWSASLLRRVTDILLPLQTQKELYRLHKIVLIASLLYKRQLPVTRRVPTPINHPSGHAHSPNLPMGARPFLPIKQFSQNLEWIERQPNFDQWGHVHFSNTCFLPVSLETPSTVGDELPLKRFKPAVSSEDTYTSVTPVSRLSRLKLPVLLGMCCHKESFTAKIQVPALSMKQQVPCARPFHETQVPGTNPFHETTSPRHPPLPCPTFCGVIIF